MDLAMERAHLLEAEHHVALGERHIARQIEIVAQLERGGHPIDLALDVLSTFRLLQIGHLAHRDKIVLAIEDWTAR